MPYYKVNSCGFGFRLGCLPSSSWRYVVRRSKELVTGRKPFELSIAQALHPLRIPIRMHRPPSAGKTLGLGPLAKAGGANSSRVERIPRVVASTRPVIVLAGRPTAKRATDARAWRVKAFLFIGLAIQNARQFCRIIPERRHTTPFLPHPTPLQKTLR